VFAAFGGQPMVILLTTAPLALYTKGTFTRAMRRNENKTEAKIENIRKPPSSFSLSSSAAAVAEVAVAVAACFRIN